MPATLQGLIGEGNRLTLNAHGFKSVTAWFRQGMIDFEKPVTVFLNMQIGRSNRRVVPSYETLLEDFYQRGDRKRLFVAKIVLDI